MTRKYDLFSQAVADRIKRNEREELARITEAGWTDGHLADLIEQLPYSEIPDMSSAKHVADWIVGSDWLAEYRRRVLDEVKVLADIVTNADERVALKNAIRKSGQ